MIWCRKYDSIYLQRSLDPDRIGNSKILLYLFGLNLLGFNGRHLLLSFLENRELDSLIGRKVDHRLVLANDEDVSETSCEFLSLLVANVDNIEGSRVSVSVDNSANSALIVSPSNHGKSSELELDKVHNLVLVQVDLDGIIDLDERIRIANGSAIMSHNVRHRSGTSLVERIASGGNLVSPGELLDTAKFELTGLGRDLDESKSSLGVIHDSVVLTRLINGYNVHKPGREVQVGAHFLINLDQSVHDDDLRFTTSQRVFEAISQKNNHRDGLSALVRTRRWTGSENSTEFAKHPGLGGSEPLHMLLGTASHSLALIRLFNQCLPSNKCRNSTFASKTEPVPNYMAAS